MVKSDELDLEEYRQALEYDRSATSLNWQMASILIAGVIAGVAFSYQSKYAFLVSAFGIVFVFIWFLFVRRNREIINVALKRAGDRKLKDTINGTNR